MVSSESERRNWVIRCQRLPFIDFWLDAAAGSHVVGFLFSTRDGLLIKIRIRTQWPYAADCQSPLAELPNSSPWTVFSNKSEEAIDGDFNVLLMLMSWTSARSCFWSEADVMQWDWPSLLDLHICSETSGRWNFPVCQLWTVCSQRHFSPATGIAHQRGSAWAINYAPVHVPAGPRPPLAVTEMARKEFRRLKCPAKCRPFSFFLLLTVNCWWMASLRYVSIVSISLLAAPFVLLEVRANCRSKAKSTWVV